MSDERLKKPSASGMARYAACPGSFLAEVGQQEETNEDAERGNRIHAAIALALNTGTDLSKGLDPEEIEIAEACVRILKELAKWNQFNILTADCETRIWSSNGWSGKYDICLLDSDSSVALIADFKTGRGNIQPAKKNLQLRALAVLVAEVKSVTSIIVAVIQPLADGAKESLAVYDHDDLARARDEINRIVNAARDPLSPRIPGPDQCKYCRAKSVCAEYQEWCGAGLPMAPKPLPIAGTWSPVQWAEFLKWSSPAADWLEQKREEAKKMLKADPESIPGWKLRSKPRRTITDAVLAYQRISTQGVTAQQFGGACKVSIKDITDLIRNATGLKGKALDAVVNGALEGIIKTTESDVLEEV